MNDYKTIHPTVAEREREKKQKLRAEIAAWQKGVIGLLCLSVALNIVQSGVINSRNATIDERNAKIAKLETKYNAAVAIETDAVKAYGDLLQQVDAEKEVRAAQAAAYEAIGEWRYIGECTITAYCPCEECCGPWADGLTSTGVPAVPGIVAVDPDIIPLGSTVIIDGQKYLAADTGVTGYCVDIAVSGHQEALECGVEMANVWVVD